MKILFFSHYFPPEVNAPATRVHSYCMRWVKAGHDVTVITCAPNMPEGIVYPGYRNRPLTRETIDGIKVIRVWSYVAPNRNTVRRTLNFVSYMVSALVTGLFTKRPDIVVATSPQFFCGWAGLIVAKLRRLPFVLEVRDLWPESIVAVEARIPPGIVRFLERLERMLYAASTHIVTVGEGYRGRILEKGVAEGKVSIITGGVDPDFCEERRPSRRLLSAWGLNGRFVVSYIGTVGMACGLDVVLRAAAEQKRAESDVSFLIVGNGARRKDLESMAREQGLDNIVFAGRQPRSEIPAFLAISDVALVHLTGKPLFTTVMPTKILEAAAARRPILLGVEGFAAQWIETAECGVSFEPENASDLLEKLAVLRDDHELRKKLGDNGHRYVTQHNDRDDLAAAYLALLRQHATAPTHQKENL